MIVGVFFLSIVVHMLASIPHPKIYLKKEMSLGLKYLVFKVLGLLDIVLVSVDWCFKRFAAKNNKH